MEKKFYRFKRYLEWFISNKRYAALKKENSTLPVIIFKHSTPLIRKLKEVEMQLQLNKVTNGV